MYVCTVPIYVVCMSVFSIYVCAYVCMPVYVCLSMYDTGQSSRYFLYVDKMVDAGMDRAHI